MKFLSATFFLMVVGCCRFLPCDPGWSYRAVGGTEVRDNGARYVVAGPEGTRVRVYASLFTGNLMTEVEVTNTIDAPLSIKPAAISLYDSNGAAIARMFPERAPACEGKSGEGEVQLHHGDTCKIHVDSTVRPDPNVLSRIRLVHDGLVRNTQTVHLVVSLEMVR